MTSNNSGKSYVAVKAIEHALLIINSCFITIYLIRKGLSYVEIGTVFSVLLFVGFILEYPSGVVADLFGRKKTYAIGLVLGAAQYLLLGLGQNFSMYILAAVAAGGCDAFLSGSLEGWLVAEQKKLEVQNTKRDYFALAQSVSAVSAILLVVALALIDGLTESVMYVFGGLFLFILAIGCVVFLPENSSETKKVGEAVKNSVGDLLRSPQLLLASGVLSALYVTISVYSLFWQPISSNLNLLDRDLLILRAVTLFGGLLASLMAFKVKTDRATAHLLSMSFILIAISFIGMNFTSTALQMYISMFVYGIGIGAIFPVYFRYASEYILNDVQSSTFSVMSGIASVLCVFVTIFFGWLADNAGYSVVIIIGSIFCVLSAIFVFLNFEIISAKKS